MKNHVLLLIILVLYSINLSGNKTNNICKKIKNDLTINKKFTGFRTTSVFDVNLLNNSSFTKLDNPDWVKNVEWLQWKIVKNDVDIYDVIANKKIGGFDIETSGQAPRGGSTPDDYFYTTYLSKQASNQRYKNIYLMEKFLIARNFKNLFIYNKKIYLLPDNNLSSGIFNIMEIKENPEIISCEFNHLKHKTNLYFTELFGKLLNKISGNGYVQKCNRFGGMNIYKRYDGERYIKNVINYQVNVSSTDINSSYVSYLNGDFLKEYSYTDIWTYRFYNTFKGILPLVENELKEMLKLRKFDDKEATVLARYYIRTSLHIASSGHNSRNSSISFYSDVDKHSTYALFKLKEEAIKKGIISLNPAKYPNHDLLDTDSQSLIIDHIEFMTKSKLRKILKLKNTNDFGKTLLMYSAHMNNFNSIKSIFPFVDENKITKQDQDGWSCSDVERRGRSALTYACENASKELIALLVQNGADTTVLDTNGNSLTYYLARNPYLSEDEKKQGMSFLKILKELDVRKLKPSFNCKWAKTRYEKAVCSSNTLANYDKSMSILYKKLSSRKNFDKISSTQIGWNKVTKLTCDSYTIENEYQACLAQIIRDRTYFLQKVYEFNESEN